MNENAVFLHLKSDNNINEILYNEKKIFKEYRNVKIIQKNLPKDFLNFSSNFAISPNLNFSSKIDDFIIYAESENLLKKIISDFKENKTLRQNVNFITLKSSLSSKSSFLWLGNSKNLKTSWKKNENKTIQKFPAEQFPIIAFQGVNDNELLQIRFTGQKNIDREKTENVSPQFSLSVDNPINLQP